jgi:hypothetical protein
MQRWIGIGIGLLLGWLLLVGCGVPVEAERDDEIIGGDTPDAALIGFVSIFNEALNDPEIINIEARRTWAERLASFFAPSERVEQRGNLQVMLANFAARIEQIDDNEEVTLEITYEGVIVDDTDDTDDTYANVRLLSGNLRFRRVYVAENGYREVLVDQEHPINDVLGQSGDSGFPVLRVGGRWFLTER